MVCYRWVVDHDEEPIDMLEFEKDAWSCARRTRCCISGRYMFWIRFAACKRSLLIGRKQERRKVLSLMSISQVNINSS